MCLIMNDTRKQIKRQFTLVPKSKKVVKTTTTLRGAGHMGARASRRAPESQAWNWLSNKISKVVLYCNPKYKMNIQESTLIYIDYTSKWRRIDKSLMRSISKNLCRHSVLKLSGENFLLFEGGLLIMAPFQRVQC